MGIFSISISTPLLFDKLHRVAQSGQVFYSQEVHFKKTGFFHRVHIVLGDDFVAVRLKLKRGVIGKVGRRYDDSGTHRDMSGAAFYFLGNVYYFFDLAFFLYIYQFRG